MNKIIFTHLYNDYSGSPKILKEVIKLSLDCYDEVHLYTSNTDGFLSNIEGVVYHKYRYKPSKYKLWMLAKMLYVQFVLLFKFLRYSKKDTIFYVNTILPFGVCLAAAIKRIKGVLHVHEDYIKPYALFKFLKWTISVSKFKLLFVSKAVSDSYKGLKNDKEIVYNFIEDNFLPTKPPVKKGKSCCMIASMKKYKGYEVYIQLAKALPTFSFDLVFGEREEVVSSWLRQNTLPKNLKVYSRQTDVRPFYRRNKYILNLTNPDLVEESFGLTLLEGMAFGCIPIGPNAGGVREVIQNGKNGYYIDPRSVDDVKEILMKSEKCSKQQSGLFFEIGQTLSFFSEKTFVNKMGNVFNELSIDVKPNNGLKNPLVNRFISKNENVI